MVTMQIDPGTLLRQLTADFNLAGGIFKAGDSSRNVEPGETERIVEEHKKLFDSFG
jgi:hypothetical protein